MVEKALCDFRGGMAREFYFDNEDVTFIPYYYDPEDDCLHAGSVSVPFPYEEKDLTKTVIRNALYDLGDKLFEEYKKRGIILYEYD